ncbi:MAG: AraC family transcriptional regulator [Proteobacteria bacterium]|nr:AraC family transcriptional regulator [Pseudomonadota bacterium]MBS0573881.1 AraC family transcriptional regulator [Pseudomonadota bacterium]
MDLLSDILLRLNLRGSLYFRTSFTSPWGVEVPAFENVARFHFVHRGRCLVRVAGARDLVALEQGDLLIVPKGASHRLFCDPVNEGHVLPLERVIELSGFTGEGALVFGGDADDRDTQLICGHFAFDPLARHPLIDRLPPFIHLADYGQAAGKWMEYTLRMIGTEAGGAQFGGDLIALKMSEIILAQALRVFLAGEGAAQAGLAGLADPQLSRALEAMHRDPGRAWSVADLAREAGLSRTGFAMRFAAAMDMTPMAYLTQWRMQIARHALRHGRSAVAEVAERVGYGSEAAFARVFRKEAGLTPAAFRRAA